MIELIKQVESLNTYDLSIAYLVVSVHIGTDKVGLTIRKKAEIIPEVRT